MVILYLLRMLVVVLWVLLAALLTFVYAAASAGLFVWVVDLQNHVFAAAQTYLSPIAGAVTSFFLVRRIWPSSRLTARECRALIKPYCPRWAVVSASLLLVSDSIMLFMPMILGQVRAPGTAVPIIEPLSWMAGMMVSLAVTLACFLIIFEFVPEGSDDKRPEKRAVGISIFYLLIVIAVLLLRIFRPDH